MQRAAAISSLILLLSAAAPAGAQSPEQAYIAARSEAAAGLEATKGDALDKGLLEAQRSLEPKLRALIGPLVAPPGFSGAGEFHPTALCCDMGAGALDGISFGNQQDGNVVVTTEGLLRLWYGADPKAALENDSFRYADGLGTDAAVSPVVTLPIVRGGRQLAGARRGTRRPPPAGFTTVVVRVAVSGDRQGGAPPRRRLACDAVWQAPRPYRKAHAAYDAAKATPRAYEPGCRPPRDEGGNTVQQAW